MSTDRSVFKLRLCVYHILLLYCFTYVKGVVDISPLAVAAVCQVGDQLELTCTATSEAFLTWQFTVPSGDSMLQEAIITSAGPSGVPPPLTISNTVFNYTRLSDPDVLPLMSRLVINPVTSALNGTAMNCFEGTSSTDVVATTTIRIIDPGQFALSIRSDSEKFLNDGVTVNLEWTLLNSQIYYQQFLSDVSISADPQLNNVIFTGNMTAQLTLSYNILYNIRVTQNSICHLLIQIASFKRIYNKCGDPMELTNALAMGYEDPALEGQNITFTCGSSQTLSGPNTSTCMENGEWEPDPREVECTLSESGTPTNTASDTRTPPPVESDCITPDNCQVESDATQHTVGIVFGVIFGIIFITMIAIVATVIFILNKKRLKLGDDASTRSPKHVLSTNIELDDTHAYGDSKDEGTLVYADIGQGPAPTKSKINTHLLDDNRVEYALLDHNAQKPTLQESSAANTSDNCPSVNLDNLLIQLRPQVGPKWYQFGEAAGIEKEVLEKIAEQCRTPDECTVELFDHWLRNSIEPPTWKTVADILKAIKLNELGLDIERVYITGTLPIVVDMNQVPKLDSQEEEESPPPLPARSGNEYIDAPFHTFQATSQGVTEPRVPPPPSNEMSAPALPPKPPRNKSARGTIQS